MHLRYILVRQPFYLFLFLFIPILVQAKIIEVGPTRKYKTPSEASVIVEDGDYVEIDYGIYENDVSVWRKNDLFIYGRNGRPHIKVNGVAAEEKAIWVIKGNNTRVANLEFSGAKVRDKNGAGIRQEGLNLKVFGCYFHDNENGVLTGKNPESEIIIENTEFANNGAGDGRSHNIYIGGVRKLTLRHCYVHHARIGHNVKSRAAENYILYSRLMDENDGASSYIVDLSNGGTVYLIGNLIQQGPKNDNSTLISIAAEGEKNPSNGIFIINNTFVNDYTAGIYIKNMSKNMPAKITNNIFYGPNKNIVKGLGQISNNLTIIKPRTLSLISVNPEFVDESTYNYRLHSNSPSVDAGVDPGNVNGLSLVPEWQYKHVAGKERRIIAGKIDIGAYEFSER